MRSLIVEKRRARALYQSTRLPSHKSSYNRLANYLKKTLAKLKDNILEQKLTSLSPLDGSIWKETKKSLQYKTAFIPLIKPDYSFAFSDLDKAELFKSHLQETFQPHHDIILPQQINEVTTFLKILPPVSPPAKFFTPNEIKETIQKYSLKKSLGFDLVTAEVGRCLLKKSTSSYNLYIQRYFKTVLFPNIMEILQNNSFFKA